jgi:hypothetical protein
VPCRWAQETAQGSCFYCLFHSGRECRGCFAHDCLGLCRQVAKFVAWDYVVADYVVADYVVAMDQSGDIPCYLSLDITRSGKLPALGSRLSQFDAAGDRTTMQMQSARFPPIARAGFSGSQVSTPSLVKMVPVI